MKKIFIGTITGTKGVDGAWNVKSRDNAISGIKKGASIYVGYSEKFSETYTLNSAGKTKDGFTIQTKEIDSKEKAQKFKEKGVFVNLSDIKKSEGKEYIEDEIIGFTIYDLKSKRYIGSIENELQYPAQTLWSVDYKGKEILIPVVDDIVKKIDWKKGKVYVELVPGLIDENLDD